MLGKGDLASTIPARSDPRLAEIAGAINAAATNLGRRIARLKALNRQQWEVLCDIRYALERSDQRQAMAAIERMEKNWEILAEIEAELTA
jgi:hypothetical protein